MTISQRNQYVYTLRPEQNGRHFTDEIFTSIFLSENCLVLIKFPLKSLPKDPINNELAMVQILVCGLIGDKLLSDTITAWFPDAYMLHVASMGSL